jgi:membrane protein DedA with SNARE-associated domain/rhodanese-related sulfurtransferase
MNEIVQFLTQHGYWLMVGAVLGRQACMPIPANLILVAAGALAHLGKINLSVAVSLAILSFLLADLAWYEAGRHWGDRILHFGCGVSRNPTSCVQKATGIFGKHGVRTLLFSKFVIGLDAVAAPLCGRARVPPSQFLFFDALGAIFWCISYAALGYIFSNQLDRVAVHLARMGAVVALAIAAGIVIYIIRRLARRLRFVREFKHARITPEELRDKLDAGEDILIVDLQGSHDSDHPPGIPGAVRISPRRLEQYRDVKISPGREVVLCCACPGEFTSARVALALKQKGIDHVRPLAGGMQAWRERGFPVTSDVRIPEGPVVHGRAPIDAPRGA